MLLKNRMEDKQLDFNQPLLSVRRFSSTLPSSKVEDKTKTSSSHASLPPLPFYKSELKSGPVRNPGTVPFLWEQTPGRPKGESRTHRRALEKPLNAPKLPPGHVLDAKKRRSNKDPADQTVSRPRRENVLSGPKDVSSVAASFTNSEGSKEETGEKGSSDSGDGDEAYLDALDTLSRTESFFLNCSVSGVSGLDGPEVKPSGTFSTDPQTRDFMMGRFLPAAKALASETPQYAFRKAPRAREKPRGLMKLVSNDDQPSLNHYILHPYAKDQREEDSGDEGSDSGESEHLPSRACGFFPRFCLKNSFFQLNPVPGLRVQAQPRISLVHGVKASSSYSRRGTTSENEDGTITDFDQRSMSELQKTEMHSNNNELKIKSNQISYEQDSQKPDSSYLHRHSQDDGISPYRNVFLPSVFHEEKGFLGIPQESKNIWANGFNSRRESLVSRTTQWDSSTESPLIEKTLYIDCVHRAESLGSNLSFSDSRGLAENAIMQPEILESVDSNSLCSCDKSKQEVLMDKMKDCTQVQKLNQDSRTLVSPRVHNHGNVELKDPWSPRADSPKNSEGSYSQFLLPPPLPKSPSESWLWRTLPSISSKNPSSRAFTGIQNHH